MSENSLTYSSGDKNGWPGLKGKAGPDLYKDRKE